MKKLIPFCLAAAFVSPAISFVPANNIAVAPQFAAAAEAAAPTVNAPITTQQRLAKGTARLRPCLGRSSHLSVLKTEDWYAWNEASKRQPPSEVLKLVLFHSHTYCIVMS